MAFAHGAHRRHGRNPSAVRRVASTVGRVTCILDQRTGQTLFRRVGHNYTNKCINLRW